MQTKLLVGTSKGLVIFSNINDAWKIDSIEFVGLPVSLVYVDDRANTWWIALSHRHWGEKLHYSENEGRNWQEVVAPSYSNYSFKSDKPASLKKIWSMQHAGINRSGALWVGTEPGGLFYSDDNGKNFHLIESLWNHPSRLDSNQWFGAGKDSPFIHSIVLDPRDSNHVYVGVSCAGVFETVDGGKNWHAKNNGLVAAYLPNPKAEVGHDPHRILVCPTQPDTIWQQNHCGIFRTTNGGDVWENVSGKGGFPKYGFALVIDENDPNAAWVIPAQSDEQRIPVDLRLAVCKTTDGGENWSFTSQGLPQANTFDLVLRHSFVKTENTLAFGTNNGNLYLSDDNGNTWKTISQNLAMVNYLAFS
ncbi:MAG: glycosyl hydrolase [Bacteroidia bacterium]|nr:glycosyl hydrolase [Bacteroidia bacterium]